MLNKIKKLIDKKQLSYADIAHELGICEMSARNKINGKTAVSKLEMEKLEFILTKEAANVQS